MIAAYSPTEGRRRWRSLPQITPSITETIVLKRISAFDPKRISIVCTVSHLAHHAKLPRYAGSIFLRLQPHIEVTATFKQRELEFVMDVFNPSTIADPLCWYDRPL